MTIYGDSGMKVFVTFKLDFKGGSILLLHDIFHIP